MQMQMQPTKKNADGLLDLGVSPEAADRALLLLGADGADSDLLASRVELLVQLTRACGNLQNAKLAFSLAQRSEAKLDSRTAPLLADALRCCDCVPAGVRLWKTALEAGVTDSRCLRTAARLGEDGAGQIRVLRKLQQKPELLETAYELARRLNAPGWQAEGSWGAYCDREHGLVWWDHAAPELRQSFGMSLTTGPISLRDRLHVLLKFKVRHAILGTTDRCHLEVSTDGRRWQKLVKFEGTADWQTCQVDLSQFADDSIYLRFHVLSGGHRQGRGVEIAAPRLESYQVERQTSLSFPEAGDGWKLPQAEDGPSQPIYCDKSESSIVSEPISIEGLVAPTLTAESKVLSSSVYAESRVEVLNAEGDVVAQVGQDGASDWKRLVLGLHDLQEPEIRVRLWSRFASRGEDCGFYLKLLRLKASDETSLHIRYLDGGHDDGIAEQRALLEMLESSEVEDLEQLANLRKGLPSLRSALILARLLESEEQIPALLNLFSILKDDAIQAFELLKEVAAGEDLLLQSKVLLKSGIEKYPSTRDHLGDGLLSMEEFQDNCRLYLRLRESWSEQETRRGLSLLLTPIADEAPAARRERFTTLLDSHPRAEAFIEAWEKG